MTANGAALAKTESGSEYEGLVMVVTPAEAKRRIQQLQAFVASVMIEGVHYGTIPGTDKPSLLQPGAQQLAEIYGFSHTFVDVTTVEDWERGFFFYRKRCALTSRRDGGYIGDGIGSCNSREERYAGKWVFDNQIPAGVDVSLLKKKEGTSKKTGRPYVQYKIPNEDICSLVNTIEKMACKRALIHAIIGATRSSGLFTQDVEDLPRSAFGEEKQDDASPETMSESNGNAIYEAIAAAKTAKELSEVGKRLSQAKKKKLVTEEHYARLLVPYKARGLALKQAEAPPPSMPDGDFEEEYGDGREGRQPGDD